MSHAQIHRTHKDTYYICQETNIVNDELGQGLLDNWKRGGNQYQSVRDTERDRERQREREP
jgi:hypothetical protein